MSDPRNSQDLLDFAAQLVEAAKGAGAETSDVVVARGRSVSVSVRLGKVEGTEASEADDCSLRVFVGKRIATISANRGADIKVLAERAVAMAKVAPEDPFQTLADRASLVKSPRDLDLYDARVVDAAALAEAALAQEDAALSVKGITNSGGSSASAGSGGMVLVTSDGFSGHYIASRFGRGLSVIAGEGVGMERDYEFSSRIHYDELEDPRAIGLKAAERAVRKINARKAKTGPVNVVFDPRVARGIAGHLAGAINGAAVARKTSFLKDRMGEQVLARGIHVTDDPLKRRGSASRPFDGEGVEGAAMTFVNDGVLQAWTLSTATARELGLATNGRGVRSGSTVAPSSTNFAFEPGNIAPGDLIKQIGTGFYVTEVIGHGVDLVTGDYSRGASGFWIENGELTHPVSEVTIAGNLKDMFMNLILANDLDRNFGTAAPTLAISGMTLAGD